MQHLDLQSRMPKVPTNQKIHAGEWLSLTSSVDGFKKKGESYSLLHETFSSQIQSRDVNDYEMAFFNTHTCNLRWLCEH